MASRRHSNEHGGQQRPPRNGNTNYPGASFNSPELAETLTPTTPARLRNPPVVSIDEQTSSFPEPNSSRLPYRASVSSPPPQYPQLASSNSPRGNTNLPGSRNRHDRRDSQIHTTSPPSPYSGDGAGRTVSPPTFSRHDNPNENVDDNPRPLKNQRTSQSSAASNSYHGPGYGNASSSSEDMSSFHGPGYFDGSYSSVASTSSYSPGYVNSSYSMGASLSHSDASGFYSSSSYSSGSNSSGLPPSSQGAYPYYETGYIIPEDEPHAPPRAGSVREACNGYTDTASPSANGANGAGPSSANATQRQDGNDPRWESRHTPRQESKGPIQHQSPRRPYK